MATQATELVCYAACIIIPIWGNTRDNAANGIIIMRGTLSSSYCCHSLLNTDSKIYAGHFRMYGTVVVCILLIVSQKIDVEGEWRNHFVFTCM